MSDFSPLTTLRKLATGQPALAAPAWLGRFELRRILGQGAQSVVWLAFDPRLEREVAIKLMRTGPGADPAVLAQWLQEARSVSRLTHPHIVPVFEADVQDHQPYLVFEYVAGPTLAQWLVQRGALPASEAVALMLEVLDALVAAHAAGIVHRDLKPSNILIDGNGRARVMDFGIAASMRESGGATRSGAEDGTPGYLSPEAAQGQPATPAMDVFSAGLVLAEMLSGRPLITERDPYRAIYRVIHEQLQLPRELGAGADDSLRAITTRALARDPALRHASAQTLREELARWSGNSVGDDAEDGAGGAAPNSTLAFLLRRMRHKSDFPAMSDSVLRFRGLATSETESIGSVTNEILKDVALTNKLLRLVNTAHYARGSGSIRTVSRAVSLVGFNGIRNMALSLVLLEHMQDQAHAQQLKEEFLRSLMAGTIAVELCPVARESEDAFIGAMFQNLGRLLAEFYFPEEARTVRSLTSSARQPLDEATASASVLGLGFEALGMGVARVWGLPDSIRRCMRRPVGKPPARAPQEADERLRWLALAANAAADTLLQAETGDLDTRLRQMAQTYHGVLGMPADAVLLAIGAARRKLVEMAEAIEIKVVAGSAADRLLQAPMEGMVSPAAAPPPGADQLEALELQATQPIPMAQEAEELAHGPNVAHTLTAGIQDITHALVDDFKLNDVLRMVLETMFRALDFRYIVFCMRDAKSDALTGRFGLGSGVERVARSFHVALKAHPPDLFAAVCTKGADTMISDATEARIAERLPDWYHQSFNAPTFLLLPLMIKGKPFGLIYADKAEKSSLKLDDKELALLRTLRNQALLAFKQAA